MAGIIRQLLTFARRGSAERSRVNIEQAARESAAMVSSIAREHAVEVRVSADGSGLGADCAPSALHQVLTNLLLNAIQASEPGGVVAIDIRREAATASGEPGPSASGWVRVDVRDTGSGIAPEHQRRVFEPFFTTREVGRGTGLGLSIVHGILSDQDGRITFTSQPGAGTCFSFHLPASPP